LYELENIVSEVNLDDGSIHHAVSNKELNLHNLSLFSIQTSLSAEKFSINNDEKAVDQVDRSDYKLDIFTRRYILRVNL